ncbi:LLM class flavin-dependent oxidoreductase [Pseudogracilibacillus sp. SE30717A]|uniref:LLM class flavin-dependent oxidoreductase n=1 Tax=Pseudogracilibacillus sp. SE30717A TaxID=3098293 RepID=UPI00300E52E7
MGYELGILDQSPIFPGKHATDAFKSTIELAKDAEDWGYKRFWVSEHHHMKNVAGSSPEIMIAHLLAQTENINIGSGGVMLQHYSPYKVTENFYVLSSLAPGRVDLGIGKAPGGFDLSTKALQYGTLNNGSDFNERYTFVKQLIDEEIPKGHPLEGIKVMPEPIIKPDVFLLGGSANSAELAAKLQTHFVFARFLNSDDEALKAASQTYRNMYPEGKLIVAVAVLAADSNKEADDLAKELKLYQVIFEKGRKLLVQSAEQVNALKRQTTESFEVIEKEVAIIKGTSEKIKSELDFLHKTYDIDEFILHTPLQKEDERKKSFKLLRPNRIGNNNRKQVSN